MMKAIMIAALTLVVSSSAQAASIVTINGTTGNDTIVVGMCQTRPNIYQPLWYNWGFCKVVNGVRTALNPLNSTATFEVTVNGLPGNDTIEIANLTDGAYGGGSSALTRVVAYRPPAGIEVHYRVEGDGGDDIIIGSDHNDALHGGYGVNEVYGRGGDDRITSGWDGSGFVCDPYDIEFQTYSLCDGDDGNDNISCATNNIDGGDGTDGCTTSYTYSPSGTNCESASNCSQF